MAVVPSYNIDLIGIRVAETFINLPRPVNFDDPFCVCQSIFTLGESPEITSVGPPEIMLWRFASWSVLCVGNSGLLSKPHSRSDRRSRDLRVEHESLNLILPFHIWLLTSLDHDILRVMTWQNLVEKYRRHIETGQVTYGNSYAMPQQGYNPALAQQGFSDVPLPVQAPGPGVVMPPGVNYGVSPAPYMSPAPYGASPVAMYPAAPWNNNMMAPVSPVPHQVPEYVKRQRADELAKAQAEEAARVKATAELEAEKKRLAMGGVWERYYGDNGGRYWQNTATGETRATDPYR